MKNFIKQLDIWMFMVVLMAITVLLILIAAFIVDVVAGYSVVAGNVSVLVTSIGAYWVIEKIIKEYEA